MKLQRAVAGVESEVAGDETAATGGNQGIGIAAGQEQVPAPDNAATEMVFVPAHARGATQGQHVAGAAAEVEGQRCTVQRGYAAWMYRVGPVKPSAMVKFEPEFSVSLPPIELLPLLVWLTPNVAPPVTVTAVVPRLPVPPISRVPASTPVAPV